MDACMRPTVSHCDVLSPFDSTAHMSLDLELLKPGNGVFYLRGPTNESVPTNRVGPSSTPDCVAIQCERSGHSQLYLDCSLDCFTLPISCVESSVGHEIRGPFPTTKIPSLEEGVGSCNHQHPRDEVFGVEDTAVVIKHLRPPRP